MAHRHGKDDWTDEDRVLRMANSYNVRYDAEFWMSFEDLTGSKFRPVVADFGCGPGLLLADVANRFKSQTAIALDESEQMLKVSEKNLRERTNLNSIVIHQVNFDTEMIPVDSDFIDFAFSGFMLHEVASPSEFVSEVFRRVKSDGIYVVYDFVSGNEDLFVRTMVEHGMIAERARKRYPHMCKHSADDIVRLLENSGFSDCRALTIGEIRAVVVGLKR
jgi:ubiquinone/menaquinone biosynthesis C-methylase UbiE